MKVEPHNDNIIRMVDTFKRYNPDLTEILEDNNLFNTIKGVEGKVYCGTFTARIYMRERCVGTYQFDCSHWANIQTQTDNQMKPRLRVVKGI